jgi:uncharacterized protein (TIGR02147 family)
LLIQQKRKFSTEVARKVAKGLGLDNERTTYLLCMAKLLQKPESKKQYALLEEMKKCIDTSKRVKVKDKSIHSNWLHAIVFEMANLADFEMTAPNIQQALRQIARLEEIEETLKFLKQRGYIEKVGPDHRYKQKSISFTPINDVRQIDLQRNHMRFLDLAKHKINEELDRREFQGLTIAIPKRRLPEAKEALRQFIGQFRDEFGSFEDNDTVIRLQTALYHLTEASE